MRFLKKVLAAVGVVLLLHIIVCWVLAVLDKEQPDTLTISLFGFAGLEAGIGGWIKYLDTKEAEEND